MRVALIGAGTMGAWYAETFHEDERTELVALCDLREEAARSLAAQVGNPAVFADCQHMLESVEADAVAVATPDAHHREPVVASLHAGRHVLCEKPLAMTLEDGLAMKAAVEETGRELMVNFGNRRRPRAQAARKVLVEERAVGEIGNVYIELNERLCKTGELSWLEQSSPVWFLLSHCVDFVRYVTDLEIVEVFGYETRKILAAQGVETSDSALFVGRLSNGGHLFLGSTWAYPDQYVPDIDFSFRALGDKGLFECQMHPADMTLYADDPRTLNYQYPYVNAAGQRDNWWVQSTRHFLRCIERGERPTPDVDDGLACLRVLLAMEESAKRGAPVALEGMRAASSTG